MTSTVRTLVAATVLALLSISLAEQIPLVDSDGYYVAYIDTNRDSTIYLWSGEPVAYLYESGRDTLVYSFSGSHLGWYEDEILRDHAGDAVGSREGALRTQARVPPIKGLQRLLPLRGLRDLPRTRPLFSNYYSRTTLTAFLSGSATTSSSSSASSSSSSSSGGTYAATGMRWFVSRVESTGANITLSDGSRWEIQTIDRIHTMLWLPADGVTVTLARLPLGQYRYTLKRDRDGREVLGRYLGR